MIVNVPIEPVEGRYSADWIRWFSEELHGSNSDFITIAPEPLYTDNKIRHGAFLDVVGTNYYKSQQIAAICRSIDNGVIPKNNRVVFIFHDGWFPIEQLAYIRDMLGCQYNWKFIGLFHAGTYDPWDQTAQHNMDYWGEHIERGWFNIYDAVVVASEYHRSLLMKTRQPNCLLYVIPWKVEVPEFLRDHTVWEVDKKDRVVFPHRHNLEKTSGMFQEIDCSPYLWMDTTIHCKTKQEYYKALADSKICVSFSYQETFGIAMVESVLLGCIPLVPDRLSYREMYPDPFRYKDEEDFNIKLQRMIRGGNTYYEGALGALRAKFDNNSKSFFPRLFGLVDTI